MEDEIRTPERRHRRSPRGRGEKNQQEVEYIQPKPFFRKKLILRLLTIAAVVVAIAMGVSIFFKVDTIVVTGASQYSAATVVDASDIQVGDSLLFFGRGEAAQKIKSQLPYVSSVRFEIKLPGTVNIIIEEKTVTYSVEDGEGTWWRITSDGVVVEKVKKSANRGATITGVQLENPVVGEAAIASESDLAGETVTATQEERLQEAVDLIEMIELYELFEDVTDIDVSDLYALSLTCGTDYQVELGDRKNMEAKIGAVAATLKDLKEGYVTGRVLTVSYNETIEKWQVLVQPMP